MTARWRKSLRDLRNEGPRALLAVGAIALGIAGFTAVLSSYAILTRELNDGYRATRPASAILRTDRVDDDLLRAVAAVPGVGAADARRSVSGRVRTGPAEWRNLVLFVIRDFASMPVAKIERQEGSWPPAAGEIAIERDAMQVARARIGNPLSVRTTHGSEQTLRVAGSVHDVGQAQARMENVVYGYVTPATAALLGEEGAPDRLLIRVAADTRDERHIRAVAANVERLVEARGHPVTQIDVPPPEQHPHAAIMGMLLLAMAGFGLFILLLSGILVFNLLTALMASEVRHVGVMKTVGGTRWQIASIYFVEALLLGAAAVAIAAPVGIEGGRVLCRALAVFLNFDIHSFAVPLWVYLLIAGIGLIVPLLASALPVWKGSGVSIRRALDDFGVSRDRFGSTRFDRLVARFDGAGRPLLLSIRNSFRRRARLVLTVATLATAGVFFMSALNLRASLVATLDRLFATKKFDLSVGLGTMAPVEKIERAIRATSGIAAWEAWITTEGSLPTPGGGKQHVAAGGLHAGNAGADRFTVVAVPERSKMLAQQIVEGRDLQPGDTDSVVINSALASKQPGVKAGDTIVLGIGPEQVRWRVAGVAREPFSPAIAYVPLRWFDERGHGGTANNIRLVLARTDRASMSRVKAELERNLEREGIRALTSTSKGDGRYSFDQHVLMIYVFLIVVACVIAGVGGLGLMTTMSLNVLERRREMGVMRAIGATPAALLRIVVAEGCAVAVGSWIVAALVSWPVSAAIGNLITIAMFRSRIDFASDPRGSVIWFVLSVVLGGLASLAPAVQATRCPIREALTYE